MLYLNFKAVLALPKTARSAQTHKSISFIWIVWSTLYVYLWFLPKKFRLINDIEHFDLSIISFDKWFCTLWILNWLRVRGKKLHMLLAALLNLVNIWSLRQSKQSMATKVCKKEEGENSDLEKVQKLSLHTHILF